MRLFGQPTGVIDQFARRAWLLPPFDSRPGGAEKKLLVAAAESFVATARAGREWLAGAQSGLMTAGASPAMHP